MIKAKKLREGPGMKGKMQPARAINAKSNPRIIKKIIKGVLFIGLFNPDCAVDTYCTIWVKRQVKG